MDIMFSACIAFFIVTGIATCLLIVTYFTDNENCYLSGAVCTAALAGICLIGAIIFAPKKDKKVECECKYVVEHTIKVSDGRYMDIDTIITYKPDTLYRVTFREND